MKDKLKLFILRNKLVVLGSILGLIAGFLYWRFVGCSSGTCFIKSSPVNMTIYGGLMGGLLFSMFDKKASEPKKDS